MGYSKADELCREFAKWLGEYPFTGFITPTVPYGWRDPLNLETRLAGYFERFQKRTSAKLGVLGVYSCSYGGYLHAHLVVLKEGGNGFSETELRWLKREWPHNADADHIRSKPVLEYIASQKHLIVCKDWGPITFGVETLKLTRTCR